MDSQLNYDISNQQNDSEDIILDSSFFSPDINLNSGEKFNFSAVTDVANAPSNTNEDRNMIDNDLAIALFGENDEMDECMAEYIKKTLENISCDEQIDSLVKDLDMIELKNTNQSIRDRTMSVETQPPTDIRRRYESDGKRQIERSRSKPMTIKLPDLKDCVLQSNQSFWLQLSLITTNDNPSEKEYIHPYKLEYHEDGLSISDEGFIRVPLSLDDIQTERKQLARIAIIKIKLDAYTFEFTPFHRLSTDNEVDIYENNKTKTGAAKAKLCRDLYHFELSRIVCRLLIEQNGTWFTTDIECRTEVMVEKKQGDKRSISSETIYDEPVHRRSPSKKPKQCSSSKKGLPVIHVKKSSVC